MSSETSEITSAFTTASCYGLNLNEIELTLGLPGESRGRKRRFSDTIDLISNTDQNSDANESGTECFEATKPPPEELVTGWPPVTWNRKHIAVNSNNKFVKVAVDGAPYMRKVDLESYGGYQQLQCALMEKFSYFTVGNALIEKKWMDLMNRIKYVSTYEDEDGDWMLVGDVPWRMFVLTCKRIRIMRSSEAINGVAR